jgi:hypothetical protein
MVCAEDVNLFGDNRNTLNKNTEAVIDASKEVGLEVNAEKTKRTFMSCNQNTGQNPNRKTGNRSFANVAKFRYLGTAVTYRKLVHEEIKRRLNLGNACYHLIQNFCLLFCCKKKKYSAPRSC